MSVEIKWAVYKWKKWKGKVQIIILVWNYEMFFKSLKHRTKIMFHVKVVNWVWVERNYWMLMSIQLFDGMKMSAPDIIGIFTCF